MSFLSERDYDIKYHNGYAELPDDIDHVIWEKVWDESGDYCRFPYCRWIIEFAILQLKSPPNASYYCTILFDYDEYDGLTDSSCNAYFYNDLDSALSVCDAPMIIRDEYELYHRATYKPLRDSYLFSMCRYCFPYGAVPKPLLQMVIDYMIGTHVLHIG